MSFAFHKCESLISLPDISKWDLLNVKSEDGIESIFCQCISLISLPDISKWNTINIKEMSYIFHGCSSLISFPDISKWNTSNLLILIICLMIANH